MVPSGPTANRLARAAGVGCPNGSGPKKAIVIVARKLASIRHRMLAEFQTIQRALARERRAVTPQGGELAGQDRQHRVVSQLVMIDEVFVTQRDAEDALHQQRLHRVLDERRMACIGEAAGQPAGQTDHPVGGAQQRAGIQRDPASVEGRRTARPSTRANSNNVGLHSVGTGMLLCSAIRLCCRKSFRRFGRPVDLTSCEKYGLVSRI